MYIHIQLYILTYTHFSLSLYIYIYRYIYLSIYLDIYTHTCVCVYIYIYIYNRHLGLINGPLMLVFPPNDFVHFEFTIKKARHIHNSGQDLFLSGGRYQLFILGVILGIIHFLLKRDPPNK